MGVRLQRIQKSQWKQAQAPTCTMLNVGSKAYTKNGLQRRIATQRSGSLRSCRLCGRIAAQAVRHGSLVSDMRCGYMWPVMAWTQQLLQELGTKPRCSGVQFAPVKATYIHESGPCWLSHTCVS